MKRFNSSITKTEDQVTDIFTKTLSKDKFHYFREILGVTQDIKGEY